MRSRESVAWHGGTSAQTQQPHALVRLNGPASLITAHLLASHCRADLGLQCVSTSRSAPIAEPSAETQHGQEILGIVPEWAQTSRPAGPARQHASAVGMQAGPARPSASRGSHPLVLSAVVPDLAAQMTASRPMHVPDTALAYMFVSSRATHATFLHKPTPRPARVHFKMVRYARTTLRHTTSAGPRPRKDCRRSIGLPTQSGHWARQGTQTLKSYQARAMLRRLMHTCSSKRD